MLSLRRCRLWPAILSLTALVSTPACEIDRNTELVWQETLAFTLITGYSEFKAVGDLTDYGLAVYSYLPPQGLQRIDVIQSFRTSVTAKEPCFQVVWQKPNEIALRCIKDETDERYRPEEVRARVGDRTSRLCVSVMAKVPTDEGRYQELVAVLGGWAARH